MVRWRGLLRVSIMLAVLWWIWWFVMAPFVFLFFFLMLCVCDVVDLVVCHGAIC